MNTDKMNFPDEYAVLDFETTGFSPTNDHIIEVGCIKVKGDKVTDSYETLVYSPKRINYHIRTLTGISNEMIMNAPKPERVIGELYDFIGGLTVIGHNVSFDFRFMKQKCLDYLGVDFNNPTIDTMRLSKMMFPTEKGHKLSDLEQRFNLKNKSAHRALSDVMLTYEAFRIMKDSLE